MKASKLFAAILLFVIILSYNTNIRAQQPGEIAYHPNPWWKVTGSRTTPGKGAFLFRHFSPQYGAPIRFQNQVWNNTDWKEWQQIYGSATPYPLNGHSWQSFVHSKKDIFLQHPEYLAEVNGQRPGFSKTTKLCVSNPELQKIYIDYLLERYSRQPDKSRPISVEPSDGGGFCSCDSCKALGSISNQVFFLANLTARALKNNNPEAKVNLYAYYTHAAPPDFDLEPNVLITVIPDGFQTAYDGDLLMWLWKKKTNQLLYRDYISIPQWKGDQPRLQIEKYLQRMKLARKLGYQGVWMETGANLPLTISLGLMAQYWANEDSTFDRTLQTMLQRCFPNSIQPMRRLFNRWNYIWLGPQQEVAAALYDLKEAGNPGGPESERIRDLKAYVHYLRLQHEWAGDQQNEEKSRALANYILQSSSRLILHNIALLQIWNKKLLTDSTLKASYNIRKNKDWSWLLPLDERLIEENFLADCNAYPPAKVNYVPVTLPQSCIARQAGKKMISKLTLTWQDRQPCYIYTHSAFKIKKMADPGAKTMDHVRLNVVDWNYDQFIDTPIDAMASRTVKPGVDGLTRISLHGEKGARYEISGQFMLVVPRNYAAGKLKAGKDVTISVPLTEVISEADYSYNYYTGR